MNLDVTGIFDSSFNPLFDGGIPMKLEITRDAKIFTHPLEDGSSIADHIVINPSEVSLMMYLTGKQFKNVYEQIATLFRRGEVFIIQCKATTFKDMVIEAMPHDEDPDMMDVVPVAIKLTEAKFIKTQFQALPPAAVKKKEDQSTTKRGEQTPQKSSVAYKIFN